jgi:ArsR family transcriptional regulator, lead/cadmium/zinc/bismuth-responsive transcriptional repressor
MLLVSPRGATNVRGVAAAKKLLPRVDELDAMEAFFKVLGDSTRLRILHALLAGELNVGDLSEALSMSLSAVSHQLSVLKSARLVRHRRDGKQVYYSLSDDHITSMLDSMRTHLAEGTARP